MSLNNYFDRIYCLNLLRRPDRRAHAQEQFDKYGIEVEWWPAVDGKEVYDQYSHKLYKRNLKEGEIGIILSNIEILKDAKEKGYGTIAIVEDDILFSEEIRNIDKYFYELPSDCDMLYLSANHNSHVIGSPHPHPKYISDRVIKLANSYSTHFVGIRHYMFDVIIDKISKHQYQLDYYYAELQREHNVYCFRSQTQEPLATQYTNYSDITNQQADYNWLIK